MRLRDTRAHPECWHLTALSQTPAQFRFGAMLAAELRLMLKGQRWWWYIVAAGLLIVIGGGSVSGGAGIVLGCAWIWPVLMWSQMGCASCATKRISSFFRHRIRIARQLPAVWLAGGYWRVLTAAGLPRA